MRKFIALSLVAVMAFSLVGCNAAGEKGKTDSDKQETQTSGEGTESAAEDEDYSFDNCKSEYYGEVKLADYNEFVVYASEVEVSDDTIQDYVDRMLQDYITYEGTDEEEVKEDSVANISYVGSIEVDGEDFEFEGGTSDNQHLDIANSGYIDGFAEGLVGAKKGETVTLNLQFPDNYGGSTTGPDGSTISLNGQKAKFVVTVNAIEKKVLPEFNDDFVKENINKIIGANTTDDVRTYFKNQTQLSNVGNTSAFSDYIEKCEIEYNEDNMQKEYDKNMASLKTNLEEQSMSMEDYLAQYAEGKSQEEFEDAYRENLENTFKTYGVICAIAEKEGVEMNKEIYDERFSQYAAMNGVEDTAAFEQQYEAYYGTKPIEVLPLQFLYQDVMTAAIGNAAVKEGERPTEAETTTAAE